MVRAPFFSCQLGTFYISVQDLLLKVFFFFFFQPFSSDLHIRAQQITTTFTDIAGLFNRLADLGAAPLDDLMSSTREILSELQTTARPQLEAYLDESWNLLAWYGEFRIGYDRLVL